MKSENRDTQLKGTNEKAGALLNGDRWRVESDSLGEVKVQADRLWERQRNARWSISVLDTI